MQTRTEEIDTRTPGVSEEIRGAVEDVDAQRWQHWVLLILERNAPLLLGIAAMVADVFWFDLNIVHQNWTDKLLDRVINVAAIVMAFWGIAVTLLVGMESRQTIRAVFDRYNITSDDDLRQAIRQTSEHLAAQSAERKIIPIRKN